MDEFEQLKEHILATKTQEELFALMAALLDEIPYDWLDKTDNWLAISYRINQYGYSELASIFDLANRHCFKLLSVES